MSISSISSTSATTALTFQPTSQTQTATTPDGDNTTVSKLGQAMQKLADLEKTDPDKAKQVLSTIASKLTDAANNATGDQQKHLQDLAAKFTSAAQTGDLSGIQPPKHGGGGHHHHHHSGSSTTSGQTQQYQQTGAQTDVAQIVESAL